MPTSSSRQSDKTLTVDGPVVTLDGSCANAQLRGTADKTCRLHVYAGSVNFSKTSSGTPDAYAVMQMKSVSCATGIGIKTPHGAYFNSTGYLYDVDGKVIKGQEVLITKVQDYGIKIMGIAVTEANYDVLTKRLYNHFWDTAKDAKINYNPSSNTLTLEKVCIRNNTDLPTIDNISANGLKIILKDQNYFDFLHENSKDNLMLRANVNTTLATSKDDNFGSINNYSGGYGGIYVSGGATLTLDGSNCVLAVRPSHIYGGNGTIDYRGLVELDCSGHEDGTVRNVRFKKKMPLCSSMNAPRFIWNRTDGTPGVYESRTSLAKGEVRFVQEDENFIQHYKYIYVGDEYIHEYNKSCFMSECIKEGYLTYSPYTKELTLHSATIETDASTAIEIPNGITMVLEGQNKIKSTSQNNPLAVFVTGTNKLTIKKDGTAGGSLTVTANVPDGGGILTNGELSINGDITVPNITVPLLNVNSCTVNVTLQLKDVNSGKPAVSANLIEAVVGSTEQAPAYFDKTNHEVIAKNGAVKIVKKSDVITYPGITFCGQEVNSVNCSYLVNQFVKSGTIKVEPYDDGTKCNIDLYDVTFSGNPNAPVFEFKPSMTHVTFFINNNNTFQVFDSKNFGYPFIESWANYCYICGNRGDDNLVVTGSSDSVAGEICLQDHATLHISKNASTSFSATFPRISGPHGTKLIVKDPYLTVTGNSHGTILGVAIELPSDGTAELYSTSSSPRNIGANGGVFSDGVLCTGEVKFVKKGESYIRVQGITLDKQTLTFTKKGQTAQLNATVSPSNATNKTVTWRSNNENVATVDANGKVTAVGKGTTQIFAISEGGYGRSAQCIVTVNIPDATGITLDRTEYTFKSESVGSIFVRATLTPANADYDEIKWSLHIEGEDSIAYIVGSGTGREVQVRPGEDGTCTLTAKTANGLTASCQITTRLHPTYVEEILFNVPDEVHLKTIGESFTITPTILPANATDKTIEWYSNTKDNVVVDQNGKVTAKNYGGSTVFAFAKDGSDVYKSVRVYVDRPPVLATGVEIDERFPNTFYAIGDQILLTATVTPANATNKTVDWKSDDESVATVNENGLVTITGWGSCHVTATTTDGTNLTSAPCYIDSFTIDHSPLTIHH